MVSFVKNCRNEEISLLQRATDCELNLVAFNCATPMASCAEILLKTMFQSYESGMSPYEIDNLSLDKLIKDHEFETWFAMEYGPSPDLFNRINVIRVKSNKFKHSMYRVEKITPNLREEMFRAFYELVSLYYEKKIGAKAPPWSQEAYNNLIKANNEMQKMKENFILNRPSGKQVD